MSRGTSSQRAGPHNRLTGFCLPYFGSCPRFLLHVDNFCCRSLGYRNSSHSFVIIRLIIVWVLRCAVLASISLDSTFF